MTAGTIFEKTRVPLTVWFEAVWLMTTNKSGISAAYLHRVLPISSYQTAWTMLAKLRQAMTSTNSTLLTGHVEVDENSSVGHGQALSGAERRGRPSSRARSRSRTPDGDERDCRSFPTRQPGPARVRDRDDPPGSTVVSDGWRSYPALALSEDRHRDIARKTETV